jgi:hypothetical protein
MAQASWSSKVDGTCFPSPTPKQEYRQSKVKEKKLQWCTIDFETTELDGGRGQALGSASRK